MTIREKIITFNVHQIALPIIRKFVKAGKIPYSINQLKYFPDGTLGSELYNFLNQHQIQLLPYFETHDIKHVLLGYTITDKDEACMQFFYLGNKHYSIATLLTVVTSVIMMPEHWVSFKQSYKRGRYSKPIGKLQLETLLLNKTSQIKQTYGIS